MSFLENAYRKGVSRSQSYTSGMSHVTPSDSSSTSDSELRDYSESSGFTKYWSLEDVNKALNEHPTLFIKGRLVIPKKYGHGTVYSVHHNANIHLSSKVAMNRSIHDDEVLVFILENQMTTCKTVCDWKLDNTPTDQELIMMTQRYEGVVVYNYTAAKSRYFCLQCKLLPNSGNKTIKLLYPLDQRYPAISVSLKDSHQSHDAIFTVRATQWRFSDSHPQGQILLSGKHTALDIPDTILYPSPLDKLCNHVLSSQQLPYTFPNDHSSDPYKSIYDSALTQLSQLCNLPREGVTSTQSLSSDYFASLIARFRTKDFKKDLENLGRRSFCEEVVITIDPDTARDFDDAIHISPLVSTGVGSAVRVPISEYWNKYVSPGAKNYTIVGYEVGIHIADATYYLDQSPWLDEMAQKTMSSIYLSDRVCPMLPPLFSNVICSLNPAVPRMAFSIVVQLDVDGKLLPQEVWFGKSIIFSYARLDYSAAQKIINKDFTPEEISKTTTSIFGLWPCIEGFAPIVALSVELSNKLALALRKLRKSYGALLISMPEERYTIDLDTLIVTRRQTAEEDEAHHLIEEFMLLGNCLVAQKLILCFPTLPIIRVHPTCKKSKIVTQILKYRKLPQMDTKSLIQTNKWLDTLGKKLQEEGEEHGAQLANYFFLANCLQKAVYQAGSTHPFKLLAHWGIHAHLYMHFTSPIRRYPDDIAHRLLNLGLALERQVYADDPQYRCSQAATFRPYKFVITEPLDIYKDLLFQPPKSLLRLAKTAYHPNTNAMNAQSGTDTTNMEALEEQLLSEGLRVGTSLKNFNLKTVLKDIERRYNSDKDSLICPIEDAESDVEQQVDQSAKKPLVQTIFDRIEADIATIGYSFSSMNTMIEKINAIELKINIIETMNHRAMLCLLIQQTPEFKSKGGIDTKAYVVSSQLNRLITLYVPAYGCSFSMTYQHELLDNLSIRLRGFDKAVSVEMQKGPLQAAEKGLVDRVPHQDYDLGATEGSSTSVYVLPLMAPISARIIPVSKEFYDGVDLLLTDPSLAE
ncbi:Ribonuclease, putative [Giardia lamblia P15]|uniref:Ribonuclease, putative n=1 Tax=Giardia intestinalis (strain P15) TaxID=658858 RepID=E1F307_GIAIA|nr:Ribonuclease, putative [Giardia lamblia P15]